jgi:hypothetical protein
MSSNQNNQAGFEQDDVERLASFMRVGADYTTARQAVGWDAAQADLFRQQHPEVLEQAAAQFRVLCLNSLMAEGGATGARYLLERAGQLPPANTAAPADLADAAPASSGGGLEW